MQKQSLLFIFFLLLIISLGCKKETSSWQYCDECELSAWVGEYQGDGDYYNGSTEQTTLNVPTSLKIENISGNVLKTTIVVDDQLTTSFTSTKNDTKYYYDVPGSNKSMNLTLSIKDTEYKLSGTVKLFHYQKDTIVIDQSISFDTFK